MANNLILAISFRGFKLNRNFKRALKQNILRALYARQWCTGSLLVDYQWAYRWWYVYQLSVCQSHT